MPKHSNILSNPPAGSLWKRLAEKNVLVAFSGGKDSLALISYMAEYKKSCKWNIFACHVNHNLRGKESSRDESFCRDWCLKNDIKLGIVNVSIPTNAVDRGIENAARNARYSALQSQAKELNCDYIVTAHTQDDLLESFFVDILTGTSLYTLQGIAQERIDAGNIPILRPMLTISTDMIVEYIEQKALCPIYDSSNSDIRYVRNFVRNKLLPVLQAHISPLRNSINRLQHDSAMFSSWLDTLTNDFAIFPKEGGVAIKRNILNNAPEVEQIYILGKYVSMFTRGGREHVDAILEQMKRQRSARLSLPQHYMCEITPKTVRIFNKSLVKEFEFKATNEVVIDKFRKVSLSEKFANRDGVCVRSRHDGDRFNEKKLKDLFEQKKQDLYNRDRAIIIDDNGTIVWVEHLTENNADVEVNESTGA